MDQSSMDWTHQQALEEAQKDLSEDHPDKLLVIALWDAEGKYDTRFWNSGMSCSQVVALLEVMKAKMLKMLTSDSEEAL